MLKIKIVFVYIMSNHGENSNTSIGVNMGCYKGFNYCCKQICEQVYKYVRKYP